MPEYVYRCPDCDTVFRDSALIANRNEPTDCECGGKADRDVEAELAPRSGRKWITENERWSRSMGVPRNQVVEFRKRFPNSTYNDDGRLLIKSRSDKKRQAKERDFIELNDDTSKAYFR